MNRNDPAQLASLIRKDRVHRSVYTDPSIFEFEITNIFEKAWVFVGHESQVPRPGDFFATVIGRQPVVMVRHTDGKVYVVFNRCGHRGAVVCNEERGNVRHFRCMYHGWTFRTNGELLGVPLKNGYPCDFDLKAPELGMPRVPRMESYRGFVFASLSHNGPSLSEHLGGIKAKFDDLIGGAPDDEIELVTGCHKYRIKANWKLQIENADDIYHPPATHESTSTEMGRQFIRREGDEHGFALGSEEDGEMPASFWDRVPVGGFDHGHTWCGALQVDPGKRGGPAYEAYVKALTAKQGAERAARMLNVDWHVAVVYPNLLIQSLARYIRVVRPISVDCTEVYIYPLRLKGAPIEWNRSIVKFVNVTHSAASFIQTDDAEAFMRCQAGLQVREPEWVIFARGVGAEVPDTNPAHAGGVRTDTGVSELPMRNQYRAWVKYMCGNQS